MTTRQWRCSATSLSPDVAALAMAAATSGDFTTLWAGQLALKNRYNLNCFNR